MSYMPGVSSGMKMNVEATRTPSMPHVASNLPSAMGGLQRIMRNPGGGGMNRAVFGNAPKAAKGVERMPKISVGKIR